MPFSILSSHVYRSNTDIVGLLRDINRMTFGSKLFHSIFAHLVVWSGLLWPSFWPTVHTTCLAVSMALVNPPSPPVLNVALHTLYIFDDTCMCTLILCMYVLFNLLISMLVDITGLCWFIHSWLQYDCVNGFKQWSFNPLFFLIDNYLVLSLSFLTLRTFKK